MKLITLTAAAALLIGAWAFGPAPIRFRSLESVTETGGPVYNEVSFLPGWNQDIWLMGQSHKGVSPDAQKWDRLMIKVDKTTKTASFFQIENGTPAPLKARCFACHSSGPRAVRADVSAREALVSWADRVKIAAWNLRIKTYGALKSEAGFESSDGAPFKSHLKALSRPLALESCTQCHREGGLRAPLKLEQAATARFLVQNQMMPPFPFRISPQDQAQLEALFVN